MKAAESSCLDEVSRGVLAVRLDALDQAIWSKPGIQDIQSLLVAANQAVKHRLQCTPTDGNAWMLLAQSMVQQGQCRAGLARLLDLSYFYAPAENGHVPRLRLVGTLVDTGGCPYRHSTDLTTGASSGWANLARSPRSIVRLENDRDS